jgi:FkbH-like protein
VNLIEALEVLKQDFSEDARPVRAFLACGFTPLHLQTFLSAQLRKRFPRERVEVKTGLFGDLAGNLERLQPSDCDLLFVVIEWQDLDPRLGIRSLGGWRTTDLADIVRSASQSAARIERALQIASASTFTCVCMPTLPLPPLFTNPTQQAGAQELQVRQLVASLAAAISENRLTRVLSNQRLDECSPALTRYDVRSELAAGFSYKLPHASTVAELLAVLSQNRIPKKGLITDLDDTLWSGILGEVGTEGISWHLDRHSHMHGIYQQFLESLASAGVLIAVASKNDLGLAEQAFEREDLMISKDNIYPLEAHWALKSESVQRILKKWNIGPDAVVFIDDSPMEVADVTGAFPEMECIVFPKSDPQAIWNLLKRLRDIFGKSDISKEDSIRLKSIRAAGALLELSEVPGSTLDDLLQGAEAAVRFTFGQRAEDSRALELINKTNQFNLNGERLTDAEWMARLVDPASFFATATYEDKYGQLGKIAVLMGTLQGRTLRVDSWVMSCRAFSRRIEHQFLKQLFDRFDVEEICLEYKETSRNGPLREFLSGILGVPPVSAVWLSRAAFAEKCPLLHHRVEIVNG